MTQKQKQTETPTDGSDIRPFYSAFIVLVDNLPERTQTILADRYGVGKDRPETLQSIGAKHGITRERVRQVVRDGIDSVRGRRSEAQFSDIEERLLTQVDRYSGICPEDVISNELGQKDVQEKGAVRFFVDCVDCVTLVPKRHSSLLDGNVMRHDFDLGKYHDVHSKLENHFTEAEKVADMSDVHKKLAADFPDLTIESLEHFCIVSPMVEKNPFGKWGLSAWDNVKPRGIREKVHLILSENGAPMHFRDIAAAIDEHGMNKMGRKTHPQTVHNELIKDARFVLVGRGTYALASWGYATGTVGDVITSVLKRADTPLSMDEIVKEVAKQRAVKKQTIILNVKALCEKTDDDRYRLKDDVGA